MGNVELELLQIRKFRDNVAECVEKSMNSRISISFETIVLELTSDDYDCHVINTIAFI